VNAVSTTGETQASELLLGTNVYLDLADALAGR
jgi:hypothetical protein